MSSENLHTDAAMWKRAINDAEQEINKAKRRIERLRESIRIFKKKLDAKEAWPGNEQGESTQN